MASPSTGVGRGNGSGGKRPGAGRPLGSRNKRTRALIIEAERTRQMLPLAFLLTVTRNDELPLRDRTAAAVAAAPYMHARLTALRVIPDPATLDDATLVAQVARLEQYVAALPEGDRAASITAQFEGMLEDIPGLSVGRQEAFFHKQREASETGLQRLNAPDRPGAVIPRSAPRRAPEAVPRYHDPHHDPGPPHERVLQYDPGTRRLKR